jgi:hypothetical protein
MHDAIYVVRDWSKTEKQEQGFIQSKHEIRKHGVACGIDKKMYDIAQR